MKHSLRKDKKKKKSFRLAKNLPICHPYNDKSKRTPQTHLQQKKDQRLKRAKMRHKNAKNEIYHNRKNILKMKK